MSFNFSRFDDFASTFEFLEIGGLFFLLTIVGEATWDILAGKRAKGETFANFAIAFVNELLNRTAYGLVFVLGLLLAESMVSWHIPLDWWSWPLALVLADFTYYWMHRWEHEVRILWSYHSVHHSSPEYNLTTALRLAWIEGLIEWVFFVPMVFVGFDAVQTLIALSVVVFYQTWIHTERIGKLGWLDRVLNTPSTHRVHHASDEKYLDRNYGGILILWDRAFGTYQREEEPVTYGITTPIGSTNPIVINAHELVQIGRDIARSRTMHDAMKAAFGRPGALSDP